MIEEHSSSDSPEEKNSCQNCNHKVGSPTQTAVGLLIVLIIGMMLYPLFDHCIEFLLTANEEEYVRALTWWKFW